MSTENQQLGAVMPAYNVKRFSIIVVMVLFGLGMTVSAQGGSRPAPSGTGGNFGGPGMSGQALNAGMPQVNVPEVPATVTGGGRLAGRTGGNASGIAGGLQGLAGGGFAPTGSDGGSSLAARFGERGGGALTLQLEQFGGFGQGSFGTATEGGSVLQGLALQGSGWHTSDTVPPSPAALSDLTAAVQAQSNLQAVAEAAQGQVSDTVNQVAAQAQQTYDQLWADYYTAVETTAQTYYDTVTVSADYLLQTYEEAVGYAVQPVDYYVDYAEQFAVYCAAYPWDCYNYIYDTVENMYVYVGDVSSAPVGMLEVSEVAALAGYPISIPAPSAEAYQAIVVFANDQLGAVVEPLYAGTAADAVQATMGPLPALIEAIMLNTTTVSGGAYWGLLNGGVAAVMVGDCGSGVCAVDTTSIDAMLSSASAGLYGLYTNAAVPTTPEAALALITHVYPKLSGLAFAQITNVDAGYGFTATAASLGLDPVTHQPISVAKVVYAGVVDVGGQSFVYTLVALGEGYVEIVAR